MINKLPLTLAATALLLFGATNTNATVTVLFGDSITDLSGFDTIKDDGVAGSGATVSVVGAPGFEKLSFDDQSSSDKPEAYYDFGNTLEGLRLDFDVQFNNSGITPITGDPEMRLRLANNGVDPTSDAKTGFGMVFRNESDDGTNQVRAGKWNGTDKISTTSSGLSSYNDVADNTEFSVSLIINNAFTDQTYNAGANTVAANTYDLYIDEGFIGNYTLAEDTADYDRDLGFGTIGFLSSSDGDTGVDIWFDNIILSTGTDSGLTAVPEPSAFALIGGMIALGLANNRRKRV